MSLNLEANDNKAIGKLSQAIGDQNNNSSSFSYCSKSTAIIVLIGIAIIVGIVLGVEISVGNKDRHELE